MTHLRLAMFDVDGTLIDSQHTIISAMTIAWSRLDLGTPKPDHVRQIIGLSLVEACAMLLPWATPATHRAVAEAYKSAFHTLRLMPEHDDPLFPGALAALDQLETDGWLLGLATGKSRRGVEAMLDTHGLHGRFVTIQTADENPSKPDPSMLHRAADECGVAIANVAMIGDTSYDMAMANAARAAAIGVSWGYQSLEELRGAGAKVVLDSFENLTRVLDSVIGERSCVPPQS
ncbi:HAD family hydrolase [Magnetospirillum molischianum]|uniref:Predicted phosphatase n=1 Tax=Magnetospirillum molischianum DSM 120 TaxID=1150626 RepID=H8FRR9_MAGML